jgi:hypothetical protein
MAGHALTIADFRMKLGSCSGFLDDSESAQNHELMVEFDVLDDVGGVGL